MLNIVRSRSGSRSASNISLFTKIQTVKSYITVFAACKEFVISCVYLIIIIYNIYEYCHA